LRSPIDANDDHCLPWMESVGCLSAINDSDVLRGLPCTRDHAAIC
jgi:hypothetical protein